jgi:hypothetical protein
MTQVQGEQRFTKATFEIFKRENALSLCPKQPFNDYRDTYFDPLGNVYHFYTNYAAEPVTDPDGVWITLVQVDVIDRLNNS